MKRILLACSAGMSTSLLVTRMQQAAEERGIEVEIRAVAQDKAQTEMEKADVLLIGPQMRFMLKKFSKAAEKAGIPVEVINPVDYGRIDGEAVLKRALELVGK